MAEYIHCHEECAHLPANPQCIYRLNAEDAYWLASDLDKALAAAKRWKALARKLRAEKRGC